MQAVREKIESMTQAILNLILKKTAKGSVPGNDGEGSYVGGAGRTDCAVLP